MEFRCYCIISQDVTNIAQQSNDVNYFSYYLVTKLHSIGASTSPISLSVIPSTTPELHITAGIITVGFVRAGSDVPSLPVMSLKIKNDWG